MTAFLADSAINLLFLFGVIILGLSLGSFATAMIYRIPRDISWIKEAGKKARSQCPSCGTKLRIPDLIPIFSWVFLRGKCRYCAKPIPAFYPLIELVCSVLVVVLYLIWGNHFSTLPILFLVPFLIAMVVIDWQHMILPDDLNIAAFILGIVFLVARYFEGADNLELSLVAGLLLPALFWLASYAMEWWKGKKALGMGDLKFLPSAGLFIGLAGIPSFLFFSGLLGLLTALYHGFKGQKGAFPFGPALVLSLLLHLFLTGLGFDYTW